MQQIQHANAMILPQGLSRARWRSPGWRLGMGLLCLACMTVVAGWPSAGETETPGAVAADSLQQARAAEKAKRYDQAIAGYRAYLQTHPEDDEVRGSLARLLSWEQKYQEATRLYKDILRRHPQDLDTQVALARVTSWQKKYPEARRMYEQVLRANTQHLEARRGLADTLYWSTSYTQALKHYKIVYDAMPDPELAKRIQAIETQLQEQASSRREPRGRRN